MTDKCNHDQMSPKLEPHIWRNGKGEVVAQGLKLTVACSKCGAAFRFRCFPVDDTGVNPVMSMDGTEVYIPVDHPWDEEPQEAVIETLN